MLWSLEPVKYLERRAEGGRLEDSEIHLQPAPVGDRHFRPPRELHVLDSRKLLESV